MVNWSDPATMMGQATAFAQMLWVLLGILTWEIVSTISFDIRTVRNIRDFKWPLGFYFVCRYSMFIAIILLNFVSNVKTEINCQAAYTSVQVTGNIAIGATSNLLMIRAIAIWSRNTWITGSLVLVALGHWAILLHGMVIVRGVWEPAAGGCFVTGSSPLFFRLLYGYTMAYDMLVLVLSIVGLMRTGQGRASGSGLWKLLFHDGIAYFTVAVVGNLIAVAFAVLDLNPVMNIMFTVPAAVFSTIVACRAVMRLSEWSNEDVYVHSSGKASSRGQRSSGKRTNTNKDVHIRMDTYSNGTTADVSFYRGTTPSGGQSIVDLERATNLQSVEELNDPEVDKKYGGAAGIA